MSLVKFVNICIALFIGCFFIAVFGFLVGLLKNEQVGVAIAIPAVLGGVITWITLFVVVAFGKDIPFIQYDIDELRNYVRSAFKREK